MVYCVQHGLLSGEERIMGRWHNLIKYLPVVQLCAVFLIPNNEAQEQKTNQGHSWH